MGGPLPPWSDSQRPPTYGLMAPIRDPRPYQITVLTALLAYGMTGLDFEVTPARALLTVGSALATQLACTRLWGLPHFDPRSALISGLSLSLLLRAASPWWLVVGAAIAITSKFLIRRGDKHVFNPTCFALVVLLVSPAPVWVSAGQWGSGAVGALAFACLGLLVLTRSPRADVTWAFLASHASLLFGRALWLGDPLAIALHGLESGALMLFAFFMISDPRTVPDRRLGRVAFAALVALGAYGFQFALFRPNGLLFALAGAAPLVPLIDRWLPGRAYHWASPTAAGPPKENPTMQTRTRRWAYGAGVALALLALGGEARAFCGFYVSKADTKLFNKASQVVLARDGNRTVVTMSNDFQGEPTEFAMVIPVPTFVERGQIHVGDRAVIEHLDAYTSPRLVEYFDSDPCAVRPEEERFSVLDQMRSPKAAGVGRGRVRADGVRIEARYTVGEYDILILSAEQSAGLARWLRRNGYQLPKGAERVLGSYIQQDMRFFVAKVNLEQHAKLGYAFLRPLQVAYESPKFMLPIRLGTLNADGPQELFVYALTRKGRVETTNYRTVKLPSDVEIPTYLKTEFGDFYSALFDEQVRRENMRTVFTEYAWDMNWCDPCAADPLSPQELRSLGVFWVGDGAAGRGGARDAFVTRLHLRYDAEHFPADLVFQETSDRQNFQGRYVLRHAWDGEATCAAADEYRRRVRERQEREARTLASLTGWNLASIRQRIGGFGGADATGSDPWWRKIWTD